MKGLPMLKKEVAIDVLLPESRCIYFFASTDAAEEFRSFGRLRPDVGARQYYCLWVDARYNFDEVLAYIQNYDKEP